MKNIILFGFMGTGKTSVGKALAKKLRMEFVDMDDLIEAREKTTISTIFEKKGEQYFRRIESDVVKDIAKGAGFIVATGGGVVLNHENVKTLEATGIGICLNASPETIHARVKYERHRPLIAVENPLERIRQLLEYRQPYYAKVSHQVDTDWLTIDEIVEEVLEIIKSVDAV
jgi:shikimate kinase